MSKLVVPCPSRIHGTGAFTSVDFPAGLVIPIPIRHVRRDTRWTFEGGILPLAPFRFLNHSKRPNCEVFGDSDHLYLQVLRRTKAGTELTIDYGDEYWERF